MRNSINVHDWLWLCSRETLLHSNGFLWRANQPLYCAQDVSFWGWISGSRAGTRWPMWAFGTLNAAEQASKWPVVYPGTHMTLLFGDLMYKLWYVCEFSKLIWCFRWDRWICGEPVYVCSSSSDIKPENLLISSDDVLKLCDFGEYDFQILTL